MQQCTDLALRVVVGGILVSCGTCWRFAVDLWKLAIRLGIVVCGVDLGGTVDLWQALKQFTAFSLHQVSQPSPPPCAKQIIPARVKITMHMCANHRMYVVLYKMARLYCQ